MIPEPRACGSCGTQILELRHERTGRVAPIDLEPVPHGGTITIADDGTYHVLTKAERGDRIVVKPDDAHSGGWTATLGPPLHRPHFETCPQADYWREIRRRIEVRLVDEVE